jgi:rod shape-determining protein MreC
VAKSSRTSAKAQKDLYARHIAELEAQLRQRDDAIAALEDQLRQRDVSVAALQEDTRRLQAQLQGTDQAGVGPASLLTHEKRVTLPTRPKRRKARWLPWLFIGLAVLFLILHEIEVLTPIESALQVVVAPLQRGTAQLVEGAGDLFLAVREARELRAQVEELRGQVDALGVENVRLQEREAEAIALRILLNFTAENPWAFLGADVVGQSACLHVPCGEVTGQESNPYLRYLAINAGREEGVAVGMPVVTSGAVMAGRVAELGLHTSKVQLLSDPGSSIAILLQESRATGLLVGQPDGSLRIVYIPQDEEVQVGDIVLTSGLGGALPRGLVVGQVAEVQRLEFALHQEAVVRPAVDYQRLELLLVISSFQPLVQEEPGPFE